MRVKSDLQPTDFSRREDTVLSLTYIWHPGALLPFRIAVLALLFHWQYPGFSDIKTRRRWATQLQPFVYNNLALGSRAEHTLHFMPFP
jgi:hypothetical protein